MNRSLLALLLAVVLGCRSAPPPVISNHYPAPPAQPAPHPSMALPGAMMVVGGAFVAGGVVAVSIRKSKYASPSDDDQRLRNINTAGTVALATGAVMLAVGMYLAWRFDRNATTGPP